MPDPEAVVATVTARVPFGPDGLFRGPDQLRRAYLPLTSSWT